MRRFWVISGTRALFWLATVLLLVGALVTVASLPRVFSGAGSSEAIGVKEEEALPALAPQSDLAPVEKPPEATSSDPQATAAVGSDVAPENMFAPVPGAPETLDTQPPLEPDELPTIDDIRIEVVHRTPHPSGTKRVLIYHTHTWEAYEPTKQEAYQPTQKWRTKDPAHNVVRVGEELAKQLRALGVEVVHDTTDCEPPNLSSAYTRSLALLERYRARGETFDLYIDLHRDAYNDSMKSTNTVKVDGAEAARVSVLIGKGTGQTGAGFDQKPNWQVNIKLAQRIVDALSDQNEDLPRPVITKSGRFNQHVSESAVLIEVGNNMNTLEQALAAMPFLARALDRSMQE